jgi:hypothetical protein
MSVISLYPPNVVEDLRASGLTPQDVKARALGPAEKAATNTPQGLDGYVLPYFNIRGAPIPFYRVKVFGDPEVKYRQLTNTPNHIYFPPNFWGNLQGAKYVILTEGEKKAAAASRSGFAACAVGGVDSWRNRTLRLPKDIKLSSQNGKINARLPAGGEVFEGIDTIATGLQEVIDLLIARKIPLVIIFDSDGPQVKEPVAKAAAHLGFELRFRGVQIQNIRMMHLPLLSGTHKVGLDDYLIHEDGGLDRLHGLIADCLARKSAFPRYPGVKDYVNRKLQRPSLPRAEQQAISMAVLSDLDARGRRLRSPDEDELYYFDTEARELQRVAFTAKPEFAKTAFGQKLYREYGLTYNDQRVLTWLATQFSAEAPVDNVYPEKVMTVRGDTIYWHLNDGQMARVNKDGITVHDNGTDDVLFEAGLVSPIDAGEFAEAVKAEQAKDSITNQWYAVLKDARLRETEDDRQRKLLSLLYYISPYFYKWRGTQLPVEITCGEPGSGKSTLYELRLDILTGVPTLRNAPQDLRNWNASVASTGGLHVTDNVQLVDAKLKNQLSDEICRLVTEPRPTIEQRKLYSDTTLVRIPVSTVFALTAVKQPFTNVDIVQRAVITELDKGTSDDLTYDADWKQHQLERFGGRVQWLAHQLVVGQRILRLASETWRERYQAKYRLINVEQLLLLAGQAFSEDASWIPRYLESARDKRLSDTDWALEAIKAWAAYTKESYPTEWASRKWSCSDMAGWCSMQEEFEKCEVTQAARPLGRYLNSNKHMVATVAGIVPAGSFQGKAYYKIER